MVGRTFESVLGPPGHMCSAGPLDPLWALKTTFLIVAQKHSSAYYICRSQFPDRKGAKFFKIRQKMTELWCVKRWAEGYF